MLLGTLVSNSYSKLRKESVASMASYSQGYSDFFQDPLVVVGRVAELASRDRSGISTGADPGSRY